MAPETHSSDPSFVLNASRVSANRMPYQRFTLSTAARVLASGAVVALAFLTAAWLGTTPPFESRADDPYGEASVVRAMPFDSPMPYDVSLAAAGRGEDLPYHTQWTSSLPPEEIARQFNEHLAGSPRWRLTQHPPTTPIFATTLARLGSDGYMTHFARISVSTTESQTIVTFDFTPIPSSLAPD
jgi:hypothetical protein